MHKKVGSLNSISCLCLISVFSIAGPKSCTRVCCPCLSRQDLLRGDGEEQEGRQAARQQGSPGLPPPGKKKRGLLMQLFIIVLIIKVEQKRAEPHLNPYAVLQLFVSCMLHNGVECGSK